MSAMHPIIAVTGSSGAGTTSVMRTFEQIFRREGIEAAFVEGDSFHRYDRVAMKQKMAEALARGDTNFSHFGPDANLLEELEGLFRSYGEPDKGGGGTIYTMSKKPSAMGKHPARSPSGSRSLPIRISYSTKAFTARWSATGSISHAMWIS